MDKRALGKGLEVLMKENVNKSNDKSWVTNIPLEKIKVSKFQPRKDFSKEELRKLSVSIKEKGVLQPVLVRRSGKDFELIAGERRYKASKIADLKRIPAVVMEVTDEEMLQLSLVENLQRSNLSPVEEAEAYKQLQQDFGFSQQEIAEKVSKDRSTVTNYLRLLTLPEVVIDRLDEGKISFGHAKVILGLESEKKQKDLCKKIISNSLSVRDAEKVITSPKSAKKRSKKRELSPELVQLEEQLSRKLGRKVKIRTGKKKGKLQIEFYSDSDLERIVSQLM